MPKDNKYVSEKVIHIDVPVEDNSRKLSDVPAPIQDNSEKVPDGWVPIKEIVQRFNVSTAAVQKCVTEKKYSGRKINGKWFVNSEQADRFHTRNRTNDLTLKEGKEASEVRRMKEYYETKLKELQYKMKSGQMVMTADLDKAIQATMETLAYQFQNIGLKLAGKLVNNPASNAKLIQDEVNAILSRLLEQLKKAKDKAVDDGKS